MPTLREIVLFGHALRLARRAQAVDRVPLPELIERLSRTRLLPRRLDPDHALTATQRATSRGARWFDWRDTCLVRAMVLTTLLSDREGVELVIGVRGGSSVEALDTHAWVRTAGREVSLLGNGQSADAEYYVLTVLPVKHPPR